MNPPPLDTVYPPAPSSAPSLAPSFAPSSAGERSAEYALFTYCSAISFIWFFASALTIYGLTKNATASFAIYIILTVLGCIGIVALETTTPRTNDSKSTPLSKVGDATFWAGYYMFTFMSLAILVIIACSIFILSSS